MDFEATLDSNELESNPPSSNSENAFLPIITVIKMLYDIKNKLPNIINISISNFDTINEKYYEIVNELLNL